MERAAEQAAQSKKPYTTPVLAAYGNIASLTLAGSSTGGDRVSRFQVTP